jgi:hypothetical protein
MTIYTAELRGMKTASITPESIANLTTPRNLLNLVRFCTTEHKRWMVLKGEGFPSWQLGYIFQAANRLGVRDRVTHRPSNYTDICPKTRTDGHPCRAVKMPGEETCYWHRS